MTLYCDIETYSRVDLPKSNAYRYAEDPEFCILMAWWCVGDGPLQVALTKEEIDAIPGLFDDTTEKVAHNAAFERICFSEYRRSYLAPFEYLSPEPWTDTAALAAEHGYPRRLVEVAEALGGEKKDSAGTRLINLFCKPNRKGQRNLPEDYPEEWQQFLAYGRQDVVTLRDVHRRLKGWPTESERRAYMADQIINDRGIQVDVPMVARAMAVSEENKTQHVQEFQDLTGVGNPNSVQQVGQWFSEQGIELPNMQKDTIEARLKIETDPTVKRVLELRQELALVAAKKYSAALDRINPDGRLRGSYVFFGAHTGRWTGKGVQPQNLPSATIAPHEGSDVDSAISAAVLDLMMGNGADAHTLKALVRAMFIGPFTVVDYASIEARVLAWIAGEEWALQAFRDKRDIYVETAKRMGPTMTRKDGKVATLALGYNGGIGSLEAMGATGNERELKRLVYQWRDANENIVSLWSQLEDAFRIGDSPAGEHLYVHREGDDRIIELPSGRGITYHNVRQQWVTNKWNTRMKNITFSDPARHPFRTDTYGGRLTENVTQAIARDILSEALTRLEERGHPVVGHVHDEILVEGFSTVEEVAKIMVEQPSWAEGLPLAAEGFTCPRYRKD